jgi:hypothetical protein
MHDQSVKVHEILLSVLVVEISSKGDEDVLCSEMAGYVDCLGSEGIKSFVKIVCVQVSVNQRLLAQFVYH